MMPITLADLAGVTTLTGAAQVAHDADVVDQAAADQAQRAAARDAIAQVIAPVPVSLLTIVDSERLSGGVWTVVVTDDDTTVHLARTPGGVHVVTGTAADGWTKVGPPVDTLADVHRRLTSQGG